MEFIRKKMSNDSIFNLVFIFNISQRIVSFVSNLNRIHSKILLICFILLFFNVNGSAPTSLNLTDFYVFTEEKMNLLLDDNYYISQVKNKVNEQLVKEVNMYIKSVAPTSKLNANVLVDVCKEYDLDLVFVLAQATIESHFGTKGKAAQTNSVWNVGTYDDGQIIYTYNDPNESIEPYAKLLYNNYLLLGDSIKNNDKSILNLLKDRGYVNYDGKRFASWSKYESAMRHIIVTINMSSKISTLQNINKLSNEDILLLFNPINKKDLKSTLSINN